ncbi:MAG: four helix bundle protein [Rickettsiales bacterium]|jgi:four helix bundle protein|nr:four helix bundle protein [Rickettsiales bacterium]
MTVKDLDVFKKSYKFTLRIYEITRKFPKEELFGLVSQMRRAAYSINSNLMEGSARGSVKEYAKFILISRGSSVELEYQLELSKDLGYIDEFEFNDIIKELNTIGKMLSSLHKSIKQVPDTKYPIPSTQYQQEGL